MPNTTKRKNSLWITITNSHGSSHFPIGKYAKYLVVVVVLIVLASLGSNYQQYRTVGSVQNLSGNLKSENSTLRKKIVFHNTQAQEIREELGEIERIARLKSSGVRSDLAKRFRTIRQYYHGKEDEYSYLKARLAKIEKMIKSSTGKSTDKDKVISARADVVTWNVQQETVLRNNIPSGYPTESQKITSGYGQRIHPVTKVKAMHKGIDIRAKNKKVRTTASGVVKSANYSKLSGNRVVVQHNFGFSSHYAHLGKMSVKRGDVLHKGDLVGISGNSGQSSGPHLHYEIRYLGEYINPRSFLEWEFGSQKIFKQVKNIPWQSLVKLVNEQITYPTSQLSQREPVSRGQ